MITHSLCVCTCFVIHALIVHACTITHSIHARIITHSLCACTITHSCAYMVTHSLHSLSSVLSDGTKVRGDAGDSLLLLRRYYHRTPEDPNGLTFTRWQDQKKGEILVLNSKELRAVQGHQANDFKMNPINPPQLRQKSGRGAASKYKRAAPTEIEFSARQKWHLDAEIDASTRVVCEAS